MYKRPETMEHLDQTAGSCRQFRAKRMLGVLAVGGAVGQSPLRSETRFSTSDKNQEAAFPSGHFFLFCLRSKRTGTFQFGPGYV